MSAAGDRGDVSVVIVNRDTRELLRACLDSLAAQSTVRRVETIVVDNGSTDGGVEMLAEEYPSARVVANADNAGYARANNQGIAVATGEYVVLLNSDTELLPDSLERLAAFMDSHTDAGVAGARLLDPDGTLQRLARGSALTLRTAANQFLLLSNLFPRSRSFRGLHVETDYDVPEEIGWVSTACAMVRRRALDEAGGLDETMFTYGTDIDLCMRIAHRGWSVWSVPAPVVHLGGASFSDRADPARFWVRSLHILFEREHGRPRAAVFDLLVLVGFTARVVLFGALWLVRRDASCRGRVTGNWAAACESARSLRTFGRSVRAEAAEA